MLLETASAPLLKGSASGLHRPISREKHGSTKHRMTYCIGVYDPESHESVATLNIYVLTGKGRPRRQMIAYWLHPDLKEKAFCDLREFCERKGILLLFQRYPK